MTFDVLLMARVRRLENKVFGVPQDEFVTVTCSSCSGTGLVCNNCGSGGNSCMLCGGEPVTEQSTCPMCAGGDPTCSYCGGTGETAKTCPDCNGTGEIKVAAKTCPDCNGTGGETCPNCGGAGYTCMMCGGAWDNEAGHCSECGSDFQADLCTMCGDALTGTATGKLTCGTCNGTGLVEVV